MSEHVHPPAVHRETPSPSSRTERRLWFGVLAAPIAWTIHELVGVAVVGRRCVGEGGLESWQWATLFGLAGAAALASVAAAYVAFQVFRERSRQKLRHAEGWDRVEFMAIAGVIISLALLGNILLFGVMPVIVVPCMVTT